MVQLHGVRDAISEWALIHKERVKYVRARHMHVIHVGTILTCLEEEDFHIRVIGQTTGDDGTTGPTSIYVSEFPF